MDSASSLAYPGSRVLAGWWPQLERHQPTALWVGYLFVHRVEALVECAEPRAIDALSLHLLAALAVDGDANAHAHGRDPLSGRLHLPQPVVQQALSGLAGKGLVDRRAPDGWHLSEHGRVVLRDRADLSPRRERRVFTFVEHLTPAGRRAAAPHFVAMRECPAQAWTVDETHHFDVTLLTSSLGESEAWKARHDFPHGIACIATADSADPDERWRRVMVDRPGRVALALTATTDGSLLGFAARAESWKLLDDPPVLRLTESTRAALPALSMPPTVWEESWRLWCRQRSLPLSEAAACRIEMDGIHLIVHAPSTLIQRVHSTRGELQQDDCTLLAGDGYLRAAALVRLRPLA